MKFKGHHTECLVVAGGVDSCYLDNLQRPSSNQRDDISDPLTFISYINVMTSPITANLTTFSKPYWG